MQSKVNTNLVSAEVAGLWSTYTVDSLGICMLKHFLNRVEDDDVSCVLEKAVNTCSEHLQVIKDKFKQDGITIPKGFTEEDVNLRAPRLFTDSFYLFYLLSMAHFGMNEYSLILSHSSRRDIRDFFSNCHSESIELFNLTVDTLEQKGIYMRAPRVEFSKEADFIDKQGVFSAGWFGKKRGLMAREITAIFASLRQNIIGGAMITGFAQVAQSEKVRDYLFRGRDIAWNKVEKLNSFFIDEKIPAPSTSDSFVTDSTFPTFSDKLMLNMTIMMFGAGIQQDGIGSANVMRHDLHSYYSSSVLETVRYEEDGLDILFKNKWFEQPPIVVEARNLVKS
ncbi:MAG: DUF3231 family protein [Bacillota bacterium]|nr:DUF3231 family protein [Bacillota bacterium]